MPTEVIIPALGVITEKVKILTWFKEEGDPVKEGEPLLEIESDKVTTEIPAPASGVLGRIFYPEGSEAGITKVAAVIVAEGESVPEAPAGPSGPSVEKSASTALTRPATEATRTQGPVKAVPVARKFAEEKGVDLSRVSPTGPHGTIMKKDVEAYLASRSSEEKAKTVSGLARKVAEDLKVPLEAVEGTGVGGRVMKADVLRAAEQRPALPDEETALGKVIRMNRMRQVIAKRLSESAFTAPHIYLFTDIEMDKLIGLRESIVEPFEKRFGLRPSINDFLIKAAALAVREYPLFNASLRGEEILIHPRINIGLAVALEDGLIVPAIVDADRLGLGAIARERADLVDRARKGKLSLAEIERGTFTLSSMAGFEIAFFTAIINPPQSGILSVGKIDERLYLDHGEVKVKKVCRMGLSADHRIIDGAVGAKFLEALKKRIENPTFYFLQL